MKRNRIILFVALSFLSLVVVFFLFTFLILHFSTETNDYLSYQSSDVPLAWTKDQRLQENASGESRYQGFLKRDWYYRLINQSQDAVIVKHQSPKNESYSLLYDGDKLLSPFEIYSPPAKARLSFQSQTFLAQTVVFDYENEAALTAMYNALCQGGAVRRDHFTEWDVYTTARGDAATVSISFYQLTFELVWVDGNLFWYLPAYDSAMCWLLPCDKAAFEDYLLWYDSMPTDEKVR